METMKFECFLRHLFDNYKELFNVFNGGLILTDGRESFQLGIVIGQDYYTENQEKELFKVWDNFIPRF